MLLQDSTASRDELWINLEKTHQNLPVAVKDGGRVSDCLHTSLYNKICLWFTVFLSFNSTDQFVDVLQLSLSPLFQL